MNTSQSLYCSEWIITVVSLKEELLHLHGQVFCTTAWYQEWQKEATSLQEKHQGQPEILQEVQVIFFDEAPCLRHTLTFFE